MSNIYVLNEHHKVKTVLTGDTETLLLNLPQNVSYTLIEPTDMFSQVFNISTQVWETPDTPTE